MNKRKRTLTLLAKRHGYTLHSQQNHYKWKHPSGAIVTTGRTISDRRGLRNVEKEFRRQLNAA